MRLGDAAEDAGAFEPWLAAAKSGVGKVLQRHGHRQRESRRTWQRIGLDGRSASRKNALRSRDSTPREYTLTKPSNCLTKQDHLKHPVRDGDPFVRKTHDAYRTARGAARFPPIGAAVYLVRNPLDVAVSYAHHGNLPIDRIVAWMNTDRSAESHMPGGAFQRLPEPLTTWSGHVSSWTEQTAIPVHVSRYEDLLARPRAGFAAIVRFVGLGEDPARLRQAVERSSFARLQAQEAEFGVVEKQPTAQSFFRAGVAGSWRTALTREQARALVDAHGEAMAKFGYLDEALAFLG